MLKRSLTTAVMAVFICTSFVAVCIAAQTYYESDDCSVIGTLDSSLQHWVYDRLHYYGNEVYKVQATSLAFKDDGYDYIEGTCGTYYETSTFIANDYRSWGFLALNSAQLSANWSDSFPDTFYYAGANPYKDVEFTASAWWRVAVNAQGIDEAQTQCNTLIPVRLMNDLGVTRSADSWEEGLYHNTPEGPKRVPKYDVKQVQIAFLDLLGESADEYASFSLLDGKSLLDGCFTPWANNPEMTMALLQLGHYLETKLEFGDCAPMLFISPDGEQAYVGILKSDGNMKCYSLDKEARSPESARLVFER